MRIINVFCIALAVLFSKAPIATAVPTPGSGTNSASSCSDILSTLQSNLASPLGQMQNINPQNVSGANLNAHLANSVSAINLAVNQLNLLVPGQSGTTGTTPGSGSGPISVTGTGTGTGTGIGIGAGTSTTPGTGTTDPSVALSIRLLGAILFNIVTTLGNLITVSTNIPTVLSAIVSTQLNVALNNLVNAVVTILGISLAQLIAGLPATLVTILGNLLTLNPFLSVNACL